MNLLLRFVITMTYIVADFANTVCSRSARLLLWTFDHRHHCHGDQGTSQVQETDSHGR